jgi:hypothetical protein
VHSAHVHELPSSVSGAFLRSATVLFSNRVERDAALQEVAASRSCTSVGSCCSPSTEAAALSGADERTVFWEQASHSSACGGYVARFSRVQHAVWDFCAGVASRCNRHSPAGPFQVSASADCLARVRQGVSLPWHCAVQSALPVGVRGQPGASPTGSPEAAGWWPWWPWLRVLSAADRARRCCHQGWEAKGRACHMRQGLFRSLYCPVLPQAGRVPPCSCTAASS